MSEPTGWRHNARIAAPPLGAVVAASLLAQLATFPNLAPWYAGLVKPSFNPPNWIFGPVWTGLYGLMAYAAYRILKLAPSPAQRVAIVLFYAQLALNAAWSWMFFAARSPALGQANVVPQLFLVVATAIAFIRLDRIAGICLLPLIAWVTFATALNAAIWRLNG
jgi:tryptophan-rich sensory protein